MAERILIVGGGIVGLSAAWALERRGAEVLVLERARCGGGASGAAAGMIAPLAELQGPGEPDPLTLSSRAQWPRFAAALSAASGIEVEHAETGVRILANHPSVIEGQRAWAGSLRRQGFRAEVHDRAATRAAEPAAHPGTVGSLWLPEEGSVDNRRVVAALRELVEVREGVEVIGLLEEERIEGLRTADEELAGRVLVAAGAWSRRLTGVEVKPVRGEAIVLKGEPGLLGSPLFGAGGYAVPRPDGRVIVGATMEDRGFDAAPSEEGAGLCRRIAAGIAPVLAGFPLVEQRCGLRPTTPDHRARIERLRPGLWVSTGHYRDGIAQAPASAARIAELLLGRGPAPW